MLWIGENGDTLKVGNGLFEQFHPLADQFKRKKRHAGQVAAWTREGVNEFRFDRIAAVAKHDWHGGSGVYYRQGGRPPRGDDDLRFQLNQFDSKFLEALGRPFTEPRLNDQIAAFHVAKIAHPASK